MTTGQIKVNKKLVDSIKFSTQDSLVGTYRLEWRQWGIEIYCIEKVHNVNVQKPSVYEHRKNML